MKLSEIVAQDSHIFRADFIRACIKKHGMTIKQADAIWMECIERSLIRPATKIKSPPGTSLFFVAMAFADLKTKAN